jgi:hypothetical protein
MTCEMSVFTSMTSPGLADSGTLMRGLVGVDMMLFPSSVAGDCWLLPAG